MEHNVMIRFECGIEDRVSREYGPFPFVQVTYSYLRVGPDGEDLAWYDPERDEWLPIPENPGVVVSEPVEGSTGWVRNSLSPDAPRVWYSDVCIYAANKTTG